MGFRAATVPNEQTKQMRQGEGVSHARAAVLQVREMKVAAPLLEWDGDLPSERTQIELARPSRPYHFIYGGNPS